jgi:hypothetical protein
MTARRLAVAVCCLAVFLMTGKTGQGAFEDKFGVTPTGTNVTQFWWSGFGMDHSYLWILEPADEASIRAIVGAARLAPPPDDADVDGPPSAAPAWWEPDLLERLPERYVRSEQRQYWRLWVDRRSNRIYALWFDT